MKLLPSLKQKKRYIVFQIISSYTFSVGDVSTAVNDAFHNFIGELGVARASPLFLKERYKDNIMVIKVNHKYVPECIAALTLIKKIKNKGVIVKSIVTSGTLKKATASL